MTLIRILFAARLVWMLLRGAGVKLRVAIKILRRWHRPGHPPRGNSLIRAFKRTAYMSNQEYAWRFHRG